MYNNEEISLTEATILALQGKLKLEETKTKRQRRKVETKEVKTEDLDVKVDDVSVSVDDAGNTIVETEDTTVIVTDKEDNEEAIEGSAEDFINSDETIDVPVEGDETIVPEEEVSEEAIEEITDEPEDIEEESKGSEENKEVKTEGFANDGDSIFGLKINCNNPTFGFSDDGESDDDTKVYPELARILQKIAEKIKSNGVSDNETITDSDGKVIGKYGFGYEGVLDPFEESKEIGKSDKVCSGEKCENCKKTEAKSLKKESKLTDYIDEEDLDKIINNNSYLSKIGCKNYEAIPDMKLSVSTKGYTDFDRTFKVVKNDDSVWEAYEIDNSGKKIGETFILNETSHIKTESKISYNKKSFEEALTKFYKFNSEKVESFKVEKILKNKSGNLKIEGKLNDKVPVTMIFNKKLEGKSFVKYTLASTNNILKESKEIVTNLMLSNKNNILECKYIISR